MNELNLDLVKAFEIGLRKETEIIINRQIKNWDEKILHVSDLPYITGELCPRQLWLRLNGYEKREDGAGEILMYRNGHIQEERAKALWRIGLPDVWVIYAENIAISNKANVPEWISGEYDVLFRNKKTNEHVVVDVKTVRGGKFRYLNEADPKNIIQLQGYMEAIDVDNGMLFYIDREGQNFCKQFQVERDAKTIKDGYDKLLVYSQSEEPLERVRAKIKIKENKTFDSIYLNYPWQCQWCKYLGISCNGADDIPEEYRDINNKVIAHIKDSVLEMGEEYTQLQPTIEKLLTVTREEA